MEEEADSVEAGAGSVVVVADFAEVADSAMVDSGVAASAQDIPASDSISRADFIGRASEASEDLDSDWDSDTDTAIPPTTITVTIPTPTLRFLSLLRRLTIHTHTTSLRRLW